MERFADDNYRFARSECIQNILLALYSFHKKIKLTIEVEKDYTNTFSRHSNDKNTRTD